MFDKRLPAAGGSFLPEDYLQKKSERRAIAIALFLFMVVGFAMIAAFFVTYRQWSTVKAMQADVNRQYAEQTKKIDQLKVLEAQRDELKDKAEVTTALIEKVPRSILLAEIINRMPKQLTLTEMSIKSKRIVDQVKAAPSKPGSLAGPQTAAAANKSIAARPTGGAKPGAKPGAKAAAKDEPPPKPMPPRFEFKVELAGLSATDEDVADYHKLLVACPLLERVEMIYSGETIVEEVAMRKFKIEAQIRVTADARTIEPLEVPRLNPRPGAATAKKPARDPMDPTVPREETSSHTQGNAE